MPHSCNLENISLFTLFHTGLEIEKKNMACQTKSFSQDKYHLACYFVPAKNGEVPYVVEI